VCFAFTSRLLRVFSHASFCRRMFCAEIDLELESEVKFALNEQSKDISEALESRGRRGGSVGERKR
jgi:hypothetical protein